MILIDLLGISGFKMQTSAKKFIWLCLEMFEFVVLKAAWSQWSCNMTIIVYTPVVPLLRLYETWSLNQSHTLLTSWCCTCNFSSSQVLKDNHYTSDNEVKAAIKSWNWEYSLMQRKKFLACWEESVNLDGDYDEK